MSTWFKVNKNLENVDRLYVMEIVVGETTVYKVGKASGHSSKQRMLQIIGSYFDVYRKTPVVSIIKDKEVTNLTEREAALLKFFLDNKNSVLKRERILLELWGTDDYFVGRSLDVFISRLRKIFKEETNIRIENIPRVGFKLVIE